MGGRGVSVGGAWGLAWGCVGLAWGWRGVGVFPLQILTPRSKIVLKGVLYPPYRSHRR